MWQGSRDSNPKPTVLETVTLPIEPLPYRKAWQIPILPGDYSPSTFGV